MAGTLPAPPTAQEAPAPARAEPQIPYDETRDGAGRLREHWRPFAEAIDELGHDELLHRWAGARRLIRENGVTYNVYSDPGGLDRPWSFDPLPLLMVESDWVQIQAGLIQRARLLEAVLEDIYGPQHLLSQGLLPAELIFGHGGFVRACHGLAPAGGRRLHLYAADVGRGSDGVFRVLGDRCQAPSGAGYALENRIVLSRMLPEIYRETQVRRLAPFFRGLREMLRAIAPNHRDDPRVVLLTPGPYSETYFEHAYLARYLGFPLVEGGDLTVREGRVFLKQLGGLQPVDVLLRRLDDVWCDPLELRGDSLLGVAGLVQAARSGRVAVANSLGSGVAECPALCAYLQDLAGRLLGEELRLPSVPTWWCGQPRSLTYVLEHLPRLVIKPTFPRVRLGGGLPHWLQATDKRTGESGPQSSPNGRHPTWETQEPIFAGMLSAAQRAELAGHIAARPADFTAQEQLPLSVVPTLVGGQPRPRHMALRVFVTATGPLPAGRLPGGPDSFTVMPGGLCRVSAAPDSPVVSIQRGGGSKDAWVLSGQPVEFVSLLSPADRPVEITRGGDELPSRVADNLYWLGRYLERAEAMTRLLRGALTRPMPPSGPGELPILLSALTGRGMRSPSPGQAVASSPVSSSAAAANTSRQAPETTIPEDEIVPLIFDEQRPGSLAATLARIRQVTRTVRDRLSADAWRILSSLSVGQLRDPGSALRVAGSGLDAGDGDTAANPSLADGGHDHPAAEFAELMATFNRLLTGLSAFYGLMMESTTRGQGWRFLDTGHRLERALSVTGLLRATLTPTDPAWLTVPPPLEAVLEITDSIMTYRRRYRAGPQAAPVLDLLLADEDNPRSVAFQLVALHDHLSRQASADRLGHGPSLEQKFVLAMLTAIRLADAHDLARVESAGGSRAGLVQLLELVETNLPQLSEALTRRYFSHATPRRRGEAMASALPANRLDWDPRGRDQDQQSLHGPQRSGL